VVVVFFAAWPKSFFFDRRRWTSPCPLLANPGVRPSSGAAMSAGSGISDLSSVLGRLEAAAPEDGRTPAQSLAVVPARCPRNAGLPSFRRECLQAFARGAFIGLWKQPSLRKSPVHGAGLGPADNQRLAALFP
jgi:hypothetical protein